MIQESLYVSRGVKSRPDVDVFVPRRRSAETAGVMALAPGWSAGDRQLGEPIWLSWTPTLLPLVHSIIPILG